MIDSSKNKQYFALDLCSGIGGFRVGALNSKKGTWKFKNFSEIDKYAIKAYIKAFTADESENLGDLHELLGPIQNENHRVDFGINKDYLLLKERIGRCDFLFAGFPCQPHSLMGNRKGVMDRRGELFYTIANVIKCINPPYFILENVRAIKSVNDGELYADIINVIEKELQYTLRVWVLDAKDYGVPQTRRRVFFVGSRTSLPYEPPPKIPQKERLYPTTWHLLERTVDEKYYLSDKIKVTILKDSHKGYNRKAEINKIIARPITRTMHKMHRASQDNYYSDDFIGGEFNEKTMTVKSYSGNEKRIRRITPREAFRIQGFNEYLIDRILSMGISDTQAYMLAGNAVPPPMVSAILKHII